MNNPESSIILPSLVIVSLVGGLSYLYLAMGSSSCCKVGISEVRQNVQLTNKTQVMSMRDNKPLNKTFDEVAIGVLSGGNSAETKDFQYKIYIQSQDLAAVGARSKQGDIHRLNGLNGAVFRSKDKKGVSSFQSIVCKSNNAGADGTEPQNLPKVNAAGKLICAAGWEALE